MWLIFLGYWVVGLIVMVYFHTKYWDLTTEDIGVICIAAVFWPMFIAEILGDKRVILKRRRK